jgi:hypothetical protein
VSSPPKKRKRVCSNCPLLEEDRDLDFETLCFIIFRFPDEEQDPKIREF